MALPTFHIGTTRMRQKNVRAVITKGITMTRGGAFGVRNVNAQDYRPNV
jgi:ribosomal protein L17